VRSKKVIPNPQIKTLIDETLAWMHIIEQTEEFGDQCLLWTGAVSTDGRYPIMKKRGCRCETVRRVVVRMDGRPPEPRQPVRTTCGERLCVSPKCLVLSTTSEVAKVAGKNGAYSSIARCSKIAMSKRLNSKLTIEDARVIRMSSETGPVLAERYGVHKTLINNIKSGKSWREYGGFFSGLVLR
jgi:hypothetical protein